MSGLYAFGLTSPGQIINPAGRLIKAIEGPARGLTSTGKGWHRAGVYRAL